ncbi:hypothetical protein BH23ACT5_BH23ACT5_05780 [soil metagenome]
MEFETAVEPSIQARRSVPSQGFIATSALASAVGVVAAEFVDRVGLAVAGAMAERQPVLYHNRVEFTAPGSDLALAGGLVAALLVGAFFLMLYPASRRYDGARLTVLWVVLHCFRKGFTELTAVAVSDTSNGAMAYAALDVPVGLDLVLGVAGVVGLLSVALAAAAAFLAYARRESDISTPPRRFLFVVRIALIPGIAGPLIAIPSFLPDAGTGFVQTLPTIGLFTVATVLAALGTRSVQVYDQGGTQGFSWVPVAWLVVMILVSQLALRRGVFVPPDLGAPLADPW